MDNNAKLAAHAICTPASTMRDCKSCPFNPDKLQAIKATVTQTQKEIKP